MSDLAPAGRERAGRDRAGRDRASRERRHLIDGWELARTDPGACPDPGAAESLDWRPARVPGTAAGAAPDGTPASVDYDAEDWWFRVGFDAPPAQAGEQVVLALGGIATIAEVYVNGRRVLDSESMFDAHELDVGELLCGRNELAICCRALRPRLQAPRRPRARWRTRLVAEGNLRFYRTMLLGRAPGFAPGPAVVGPWRPVVLERRRGLVLEALTMRARSVDGEGMLECRARLRALPGSALPERLAVTLDGATGVHEGALRVVPGPGGLATAGATITVPAAELWWPHTHGRPALYRVRIGDPDAALGGGRVGFRRLRAADDIVAEGLDLQINDVPVFARGAVWTPLDLRAPHAAEPELRRALDRVVACGMNMLRVPGIGAYESETFYDLCDELGILVWQDFMFANLDYPERDPQFMVTVEREARGVLAALGARPSLAVLCGGSEVAQQVAMAGLDPGLADGPLYGELLPRLVREAAVEAPYIASTPWGGELPFRTDKGIANYYGVGAYRRPLEDARRAEVRFAAECLAFANVPDEAALATVGAFGGAAWKAGVPRDVGAGWDFDDVRDHYFRLLLGLDPVAVRSVDPERFLELSRAVSGEVMGEVFGEWRRAGSTCRGALVLWLKDLVPGAGWGVLDDRGEPKVAYHHLRRTLAPVAVWSTDEGLGGIVAHVANDRPQPLVARLRVSLYRDFELLLDEAVAPLELAPHSQVAHNVEALLGRFVDAAWAYRFGPPAQDLIVLSLERDGSGSGDGSGCGEDSGSGDGSGDRSGDGELVSQAFRFPAGRPLAVRSAADLGLTASLRALPGGAIGLAVAATKFAYGVRAAVPGFAAGDDAFGVEPGHERILKLTAAGTGTGTGEAASVGTAAGTIAGTASAGAVTALNLAGRVRIASR